jgi:hypothetical protein
MKRAPFTLKHEVEISVDWDDGAITFYDPLTGETQWFPPHVFTPKDSSERPGCQVCGLGPVYHPEYLGGY